MMDERTVKIKRLSPEVHDAVIVSLIETFTKSSLTSIIMSLNQTRIKRVILHALPRKMQRGVSLSNLEITMCMALLDEAERRGTVCR